MKPGFRPSDPTRIEGTVASAGDGRNVRNAHISGHFNMTDSEIEVKPITDRFLCEPLFQVRSDKAVLVCPDTLHPEPQTIWRVPSATTNKTGGGEIYSHLNFRV